MPKYAARSDANQQEIKFIVHGVVVPKQSTRIRIDQWGRVRTYPSKRVKDWQSTVCVYATLELINHVDFVMFECPVKAEYKFYLPDRRHRDLDNCAKGISDALEGVLFKNDIQIEELHLYKYVDKENPRVEVVIGRI